MKESSEIKVRELQNKVNQNKEELTDVKLDTVIEGQDYAEATADTRAQNAETKADTRAQNAETKADERAKASSDSHERREVRWKKRFAYAIVGGAGVLVLVYTAFIGEMKRRDSIKDNEIKIVNQNLSSIQAQYQESKNQIKHGVKKQLDELKAENKLLKEEDIKKDKLIQKLNEESLINKMMLEAYQTIAENVVPMNLQQYIGIASDSQWIWYASMAAQRNSYNVINTIVNFSSLMGIKQVNQVVVNYYEEHPEHRPADKLAFEEIINNLPDEQRKGWERFAASLREDEEATIKYIEMQDQKDRENYDGDKESVLK